MANKFLVDDAESTDLLPRRSADYVDDGHLAKFVAEAVEGLDLSEIEAGYSEEGRRAYAPRRLLALWIYGYATGVNTVRTLSERCRYDLRYRHLCGDLPPERDTLNRFRRRCEGQLDAWFLQVLGMAAERNLTDLARVCVDGTKMKANAGLGRTRTWKWALKQEETLTRALELQEEYEARDAERHLSEEESSASREHLERSLEHVREVKRKIMAETLEAAAESAAEDEPEAASDPEPEDDARYNTTDPDSRVMKTAKHFWQQSYNAQIGVDPDTHLVMTRHVSQAPNDQGELEPALAACEEIPETVGEVEAVVADAGYYSKKNLEACDTAKRTPYLAPKRKLPDAPPDDDDPAGDLVRDNAQRLSEPAGKEVYALRSGSVETVFGILRNVMKFNEFRLRGLSRVNAEWTLVCLAWNLKRMHALCRSIAPQ